MEEIYYAFNPWWENREFDYGILRNWYLDKFKGFIKRKQIEIVIGSRRVGKTTILKQLIKGQLDNGFPPINLLYLALDHPQLSGATISEHLRTFRKIFMHDRNKKLLLFLDEVQESPKWEVELKSVYDLENLKIVCTGSTSSLIKSQGGRLTGRQIVNTIYPLNFDEYLSFKGIKLSRAEGYKIEKFADEYLNYGGYPEQVLNPSSEYLINLLEDIIARDVVRLYRIRKANLLKDIVRLLAASVGNRTSFNKLANVLGISIDTVKEYIGYLETAFLLKPLEKWTTSHTEKVYAYKKFYFVDTGMKTIITGKGDLGSKAENSVFMNLLKTKQNIGYYAESEREVDFIIGSHKKPCPIEVKYSSGFDWQSKKYAGVKLFLHRHPQTKKILVITKDTESKLKVNKTTIETIPLWKFLLQKTNHRFD